jgi:RNA recognition motif-containing protein
VSSHWYELDQIGQSDAQRCHGHAALHTEHAAKERELGKKLYVGNLPFSATESDLRSLFQSHGTVASVNVIMDRETGRARGFAFVEMEDANAAANAIRALDGSDMGGRSLRVNEAQDKRGGGGGGGGGRRDGGGGGGRRDRY